MRSILDSKVALVTGATSGIGLEICKKLLQENVVVIGVARDTIALSKIEATNENFSGVSLDLSVPIDKKLDMLNMCDVDILVNCAAKFELRELETYTPEDIIGTFQLNVMSPISLSHVCVPSMKKKQWGRIINIGSSSSYHGSAKSGLYCATKHALLGFSRAMREELKHDNIRVSNISPASTQTRMGRIPLHKPQVYETFIDPREVAEAVLFVCKLNTSADISELRIDRVHVQ